MVSYRSIILPMLWALCSIGLGGSAFADSESDWTDLVDDTSRATLFADEVIPSRLIKDEQEGTGPISLAIPKEFIFPDDARFDRILNEPRTKAVFGIDISHHTGNIRFNNLALQRISFVYSKATQGIGFKDPQFGKYWGQLQELQGNARLYRGAYHFLTAGDDPEAQARSFLKYMAIHGGVLARDMPPCLDLEWDRTSANPDRWKGQDGTTIINKAKKWLEMVEKETGRTPILYTARSWWKERGIDEAKFRELDRYKVWIADYSTSHKAAEKPSLVNGKSQSMWQFTDDATLTTGYERGVDANIYYGTSANFERDFQITR